ncbi:non-hydrolyzing UDP-N-acetylglucosamine 2-epimerase [Weissella sagaensis]|jgi:UDP-N-acetylglucosamine 2-epimerase (non-hydrolysing)|uniref:non-hydrolyzing UDP-N-acetylglucosamine 2-epimerase n=1 Tax=Weissella sagaensis TaxID=2559928 RepID=UPI00214AC527|nr:UDP-N-acetylglucosamine 2-epimerase (non-hydrolyzing) [Weissella sagaensis]
MLKIMSIFGTRPEAIKMAPVIKEIEAREDIQSVVVVTGQHREMLQQVLQLFKITPDYDLNIMEKNQSLSKITSKVILGLDSILEQENPNLILVHGDTTTTMAASMSAFYHQVPIGHVEAGLRTWNKYSPYPEEMNRMITDDLADLYFAPTQLSENNLLKEGHTATQIFVTGNTVIDVLRYTVHTDYRHGVLDEIPVDHKIILLTMHRRENQGQPMRDVFTAIKEVAIENSNIDVIYPVHLSPNVQKIAHEIFANIDNIHLIAPLEVTDFHNLAARSYFIMTDSGGVQEEAPSLNKPVLVLRDTTERPEGVDAGTLELVGTDTFKVKQAMLTLLHDADKYQRVANAQNPYGDGHTAERIVNICQEYFSKKEVQKN